MKFIDDFNNPKDPLAVRVERFNRYLNKIRGTHDWMFQRAHGGGAPCSSQKQRGSGAGPRRHFIRLDSNDYLGLGRHPAIKRAFDEAFKLYGMGTDGSPLLSGYSQATLKLEHALAGLHHKEDAVVFASTYAANLAVLQGLLLTSDCVILDQAVHTSVRDGALLAGCQVVIFKHNDPGDLEKILKKTNPKKTLVCVDSVYSMRGCVADLVPLVALVKKSGAMMVVDEAHAVGVFGKKGEGRVCDLGLSASVNVITGSLGKALATHGGYVAADRSLCQFLRYRAHPYMFSSALPPTVSASALKSLEIMRSGALVQKLKTNIRSVREAMKKRGLAVNDDDTATIPVPVGDEVATMQSAARLRKKGILINPSIYPAVPKGRGILRMSISAQHSVDELSRAVMEIAGVGRKK
ncbi:MAG: aminotransferase class I/II-fold pyridoxal phosphate-dependent enzyme [Deltaproteobacteria bacterium]|nr:aminotransferase class I/II-fold pyridoxal phosphate-dependent enzyme [Deltaproteobacteria bacterium]